MGIELTVSSGGVRLAVRDFGGDGPTVLLIHGAGMNLEAWGPLVDHIQGQCRLIGYDLPGHGLSGAAHSPTWESSVNSIGAVIDTLSLGSPLLVGHSLGGMLALAHLDRDGAGSGLIDVDGWVGPPLTNRFTSEALSGIEDQLLATAVATGDGLDNLIALQRSVGSAEGQDLDATDAVLRRSYPFGEGDKAFRRPTPAESIARMRHLAEVDLRVRADELGVPVLFVMATKYQAASGPRKSSRPIG